VFLGLGGIDRMPVGAAVKVMGGAKADQDFVAPGPDPVIRRPAAEAAGFLVDDHVAGRRDIRGRQAAGKRHGQQQEGQDAVHGANQDTHPCARGQSRIIPI
jgi:hypothetical protein